MKLRHFVRLSIHAILLVEITRCETYKSYEGTKEKDGKVSPASERREGLADAFEAPTTTTEPSIEGFVKNRSRNPRIDPKTIEELRKKKKSSRSRGGGSRMKSKRKRKFRTSSQNSKKFHYFPPVLPPWREQQQQRRRPPLPQPQGLKKQKRSNIILILTDDLDIELGSLNYMPKLLETFGEGGVMFSNAYTSTPMCCPSRSSMLTGMYIHNHHVYTNHQNCSSQVWQESHEKRSFASYLNKAGYRTGYFGKYLNQYDGYHVPPGWQDWGGLVMNSRYYNYTVNRNNVHVKYSNRYPQDYYPHVITKDGLKFLKSASDDPFLLVLSYPSPHGPEDSAPEHAHKFFDAFDHHTASYNYAPNPDKQWVLQFTDRMPEIQLKFTDLLMTKRLQTLQTVDSAIERILKVVDEIGETDNTYIFFTSDHGYHLGQYGLTKGKSMPFEFDIKVPFLVKGPRVKINGELSQIALNVDLAPTFLDIAGVSRPSHMDGRSLLPILLSSTDATELKNIPWRDSFLVESSGRIREEELLEKQEQRMWERDRVLTMTVLEASSFSPKPNSNHTVNLYTSKHEKLEEVCKRREFSYPCLHDQKWYCFRIKNRWKIKKCRQRIGMWQKHCVCNYEQGLGTFTKLEQRERRKQKNFLKKYGSQDFHRFESKFVKAFTNLEVPPIHRSKSRGHHKRMMMKKRRFGRSLSENASNPEIRDKILFVDNSSTIDSVHTFVEEEEIRDLEEQILELSIEMENLKKDDGNLSDSFIPNLVNRIRDYNCSNSNLQTCRGDNPKDNKIAIEDHIRRLKQQLTANKNILNYYRENKLNMKDFNPIAYGENYSLVPPKSDSTHLKAMPGHLLPPDTNFNMTDLFRNFQVSFNNDVVDLLKSDPRSVSEGVTSRNYPQRLYPIPLTDLIGELDNIDEDHKVCWCNEKIFRKLEIKRSRERRRRERLEIKHVRSKKKRRKKKEKSISCNYPKLNCYTHSNQHWKTPPLWTDGDFCFCINSANNTYWCLRTINETENTLYCEFITGLITYYDLHIDPYQLRNVAFTLSTDKVLELHSMLTKLRSCVGADDCDGFASKKRKLKKNDKPYVPQNYAMTTLLVTDKFKQLSQRAKMSQRRIKKERRRRKQLRDEMNILERMIPFPAVDKIRHPRKSRHDRKDRKLRRRRKLQRRKKNSFKFK